MSDARVTRLQQQNERLKQELDLPRVKASVACEAIVKFCQSKYASDPLASNSSEKTNYDNKAKPCSLL
eukprot:Pgem_evm1s13404